MSSSSLYASLASRGDIFSSVAEALVPTGTFGNGPHAGKTLRCARICIFLLYTLIVLMLLFTISAFMLGRVEIVDHRIKYDRLEAPSVAVCPWEAGAEVARRANASYDVYAVKSNLEGQLRLPAVAKACRFDRLCLCMDLFGVDLEDVDEGHTGMTGQTSEREVTFRERIEIHTSLIDPSPLKTLKFGLYDSRDPRPTWFYSKMGTFSIGQLRLDSWMLSETSWQMVERALLGHKPKFWRHFYTYTASQLETAEEKDEDGRPYTRLSYEYKTFFVVETISSYKSWSLYGLISVIILLVALSNLLVVWDHIFPVQTQPGEVQRRHVARPVKWLVRTVFGEDLGEDEESPKASAKAASEASPFHPAYADGPRFHAAPQSEAAGPATSSAQGYGATGEVP